MMKAFLCVFLVFLTEVTPQSTPPKVETTLLLLDSYVPAGMQVIAHVTDLMKYDLKPSTIPATTTTTTPRPTRPHSPGIFAPESPPGHSGHLEEYLHVLRTSESYFDRYKLPLVMRTMRSENQTDVGEDVDAYFGGGFGELLRLVNEPEMLVVEGEEEAVKRFVGKFDDDAIYPEVRQKKVPPTKAYVTLLSLYDHMNKEAKKLMLNKYNGYSQSVLDLLNASSGGSSVQQLRLVLSKIVENKNIRQENVLKKVKTVIEDIDVENSYINQALVYIPPLQFSL